MKWASYGSEEDACRRNVCFIGAAGRQQSERYACCRGVFAEVFGKDVLHVGERVAEQDR